MNAHNRKKWHRLLLYKTALIAAIAAVFLCSCAVRPAVGSWDDAVVVAEQRYIIEQQREYIDSLERVIQSGSEHLRRAKEGLGSFEAGNIEFGEWLLRVDEFVRAVIEEQRRLEAVQQPDWREAAGTR